ncbi:MAG: ABC transporter permease subunit [Acidimicrobiales bacterium]
MVARRAARSGILWGSVFGAYVASAALGYSGVYKTAAARRALAAQFSGNSAVSAIVGPAHEIQTVAGYTQWKCSALLCLLAAIWGVLTGTKLLRGEEDSGRLELLLAGPTTRGRGAGAAVEGLGAGAVVLFVVSGLVNVAVGRFSNVSIGAGPMLFLALTTALVGALFLALGALASQLAATRRRAASWSAAALGVAYVLRMVADADPQLRWMRWTTPLGWVEQSQPLTAGRVAPLVFLVLGTLLSAGAAVVLASRRDLLGSVVSDRDSAPTRTALLGGSAGLAMRQMRPTLLGWATGIAVAGVVYGSLTQPAAKSLTSSPEVAKVLARLGGQGAGAKVFLGVIFLMLAVLVALVATGQITAARHEEQSGRLDHLLVQPVSRWRWLGGRAVVAVVTVALAGALAGISTLVGTVGQHTGVGSWSVLDAGLNIVAPALCVVGVGIACFGLVPRAAVAVTYAVVAWSLLVEFVGGALATNHLVLDMSLFHQMASSPSVAPNWASAAVMLGIGTGCAAIGFAGFARRDLVGE